MNECSRTRLMCSFLRDPRSNILSDISEITNMCSGKAENGILKNYYNFKNIIIRLKLPVSFSGKLNFTKCAYP